MNRLLATLAIAIPLSLGIPALAQVQLDHNTAQTLTDLGIDTSQVKDQDDVGYINQILASDADAATKKAEILKLLEEE
jgi:hypothetical protein